MMEKLRVMVELVMSESEVLEEKEAAGEDEDQMSLMNYQTS